MNVAKFNNNNYNDNDNSSNDSNNSNNNSSWGCIIADFLKGTLYIVCSLF